MKKGLGSLLALALGGSVVLGAVSGDTRDEALHISLRSSFPAKDTVLVQPPTEIRLWFSGVPRQGATSIRLLDATGEAVTAVHVMDVAPDPDDGKVQFAHVHGDLASGRYSVSWATTAADGAPADGQVPFTVRTQ